MSTNPNLDKENIPVELSTLINDIKLIDQNEQANEVNVAKNEPLENLKPKKLSKGQKNKASAKRRKAKVKDDKLFHKVSSPNEAMFEEAKKSLSSSSKDREELTYQLPWVIPEDRPWKTKFKKIEDPYNLLDNVPIKERIQLRTASANNLSRSGMKFIGSAGAEFELKNLEKDEQRELLQKITALEKGIVSKEDLARINYMKNSVNKSFNKKSLPYELEDLYTELEIQVWLEFIYKSKVYQDYIITYNKIINKKLLQFEQSKILESKLLKILPMISKPSPFLEKLETSNELEFIVEFLTDKLSTLFKKYNLTEEEKNIFKKNYGYYILGNGTTEPGDPYGIFSKHPSFDNPEKRHGLLNKPPINLKTTDEDAIIFDNYIHRYASKDLLLELYYWRNRSEPKMESGLKTTEICYNESYTNKVYKIFDYLKTNPHEKWFSYLNNYPNDQLAQAIIKSKICEKAAWKESKAKADLLKNYFGFKKIDFTKPKNVTEDMMMFAKAHMSAIMSRPKSFEMDETELTYAMISQYRLIYKDYLKKQFSPDYFSMY